MRKLISLLVLSSAMIAARGPAFAELSAEKCQAQKTKLAGQYFACREKADADAILSGLAAAYTKCSEKFLKKWDAFEAAGATVCPDDVLAADMDDLLSDQASMVTAIIGGASLPGCGDGEVNAVGEHCDGADLDGYTCASFDLPGTLSCNASCGFDVSGCAAVCGNGVVEAPFETCDGSDFAGASCLTTYEEFGTLSCDASCHIDSSECGDCEAAGGTSVGGACWLLGLVGQNCDQTCAAFGGAYDPATDTYAGNSAPSSSGCQAVAAALKPSTPFAGENFCGPFGCIFVPNTNVIARCTGHPTSSGSSTPTVRRFCACQ